MKSIFLSSTLLLFAGMFFPASAQDSGVKIDMSKSTVAYKYYPPDSQPPPEVLPGMKGNTQYNFPFGANYNFSESHSKIGKDCAVTLVVNNLEMRLGLSLDITLPKGCSEHLRSHEEGHRRIYEYFYTTYADLAARKASEQVFGKPVTGQAHNCKDAKDAAIASLNDKLAAEYRKNLSEPAKKANECYDGLTDHGRYEQVDSMTAADQTIRTFTERRGVEQASSQAPGASPETSGAPSQKSAASPETSGAPSQKSAASPETSGASSPTSGISSPESQPLPSDASQTANPGQ
jgi:hypothetical protein